MSNRMFIDENRHNYIYLMKTKFKRKKNHVHIQSLRKVEMSFNIKDLLISLFKLVIEPKYSHFRISDTCSIATFSISSTKREYSVSVAYNEE